MLRVVERGNMPQLDANVERRVAAIWTEQVSLRPALFNGRVFSVDHIDHQTIFGHWSEYRRIAARIHDPSLASTVKVRALAVAGLIVGPDGILFGRRPAHAVYQPGILQCAPAGNVDPKAVIANRIELLQALHLELGEELGLPPSAVTDAHPVAIVQHVGIGIVDVCFRLATSLSADALRTAHRSFGDGEYPEIAIVPVAELPSYLATRPESIGPQVPLFLRAAGLLP